MNFFLRVLRVFLDFTLDIIHKSGEFSQTFSKKGFKLFLTRGCNSVALDPILVLLQMKEDPVLKKEGCKKYAFVAFDSSHFEMVLALLTEVVVFHMRVSIVQVWISCFERPVQGIFSRLSGLW